MSRLHMSLMAGGVSAKRAEELGLFTAPTPLPEMENCFSVVAQITEHDFVEMARTLYRRAEAQGLLIGVKSDLICGTVSRI